MREGRSHEHNKVQTVFHGLVSYREVRYFFDADSLIVWIDPEAEKQHTGK